MIDYIKERFLIGKYRFTIHSLERCIERNISPNEILEVILSGEIIEEYPKDKYGPSCLIYGKTNKGKIIHVQCSLDPIWIITAYDPSLKVDDWEDDFKRRRRKP